MAGAGYDIGASFSGSSASSASNSGAVSNQGGGVQFVIADQGSTAAGSSTTKSILLVVGIMLGIGLVGFVAWRFIK